MPQRPAALMDRRHAAQGGGWRLAAALALGLGLVVAGGCAGERLPKDGSLTVKLHDHFADHHGRHRMDLQPAVQFSYGEWTYEGDDQRRAARDRKTHGTDEHLKNMADDVGKEVAGQIAASLFEIMIKGTIQLTALGIQAGVVGLSDDEVMLTISSANGRVTKVVDQGFNRWRLSRSEAIVFAAPWAMELWSTHKYRFFIRTAALDEDVLLAAGHVVIDLEDDGGVRINGTLRAPLEPATQAGTAASPTP